MNINKVMLVGRLTRDPEIRNTPSGQSVASISLATSYNWKDKAGQKQEKTEFHNIIAWGRLAEIVGQYLVKGQEAYFEGRLQTTKYTDKSGVDRYKTEIVAENMQLGAKPRNAYENSSRYSKPNSQPNATVSQPQPEAPLDEIPTINLDEEENEIKIEDVPF